MQNQEFVVSNYSQQVLAQVRKAVVGKDHVLVWVLATILAKGHILLEDIPGVGKTTMAVAFSKVLGLTYNRVQFTPDVLPSDVTGYSVLDQATGKMTYREGAVLCNLFLADELNRATSRTQAALLEAMEEGQVTVDGVSHSVPKPFTVIATQNPTGAAGTQLLPDSQMDRFMIRLSMGYPDPADEMQMILHRRQGNPLQSLEQVLDKAQLLQLQELVDRTYIGEPVIQYVVELLNATRNHPLIVRGGSPRSTLAVVALSKSIAQLRGRDFVVPEDVQEVFPRVLAHRLLLGSAAHAQHKTSEMILREILAAVPRPKLR